MSAATRASGFLDRKTEREHLDALLADVRAGHSAALVLRGEAGVGKTALLRYVAEQASDFRAAQIAGVEAEMELPFAGIHQLCAPVLDRLDALPAPQREALRVALGLAAGNPPDRFLISLAALSLLSAVAEERPLLCVVDDAQWLDGASAQVLTFVARHRRVDARAQLRAAHELFATSGMEAFAERANAELVATGATVRTRAAEARDELTAAGAADRSAGPRRAVEPRDRCTAVPQPPHRRMAPPQGVRQARDPVPPRARGRAAGGAAPRPDRPQPRQQDP